MPGIPQQPNTHAPNPPRSLTTESDGTLSNPLHNLLLDYLPRLAARSGEIDYPASDPGVLVQVACAADEVVARAHSGLTAIGQLLVLTDSARARSSSQDALGAVGLLIQDLTAIASACVELAAQCRRETIDFDPP